MPRCDYFVILKLSNKSHAYEPLSSNQWIKIFRKVCLQSKILSNFEQIQCKMAFLSSHNGQD